LAGFFIEAGAYFGDGIIDYVVGMWVFGVDEPSIVADG
jgi:hypothetical protein